MTFVLVRKRDKALFDQMHRAMTSVVLNIAEADGNDAGTAKARFASACGSAKEVRAGLRLAVAYGYVPEPGVEAIDAALDEVCAMSWRLSGRQRPRQAAARRNATLGCAGASAPVSRSGSASAPRSAPATSDSDQGQGQRQRPVPASATSESASDQRSRTPSLKPQTSNPEPEPQTPNLPY
jgi:four helix bundle protein